MFALLVYLIGMFILSFNVRVYLFSALFYYLYNFVSEYFNCLK